MDDVLEKTLQGERWNEHPIHPALVNLPIGMWCLGATLDFIAMFSKNRCIQEAADDALVAGLVGAGLSAVTGLAEFKRVPQNEEAQKTALTHAVVNVSAVAITSVNSIIRSGRRAAGRPGGMFPKLLSWTTMGLLTYSGWLGGNLVYDYGTGVDTNRPQRAKEQQPTEQKTETKPQTRQQEIRSHA